MLTKIIVGVLVLGGISFFVFKNNTDTVPTDSSTEQVASEDTSKDAPKDFNEKTTLAKLVEKGGSHKCTFSHTTQVGTSTGTVYIYGKKIRGDFVSKVSIAELPGLNDIHSSMISDGESIYTWSSMTPEGYKASVQQETSTTTTQTNVPTNQELDYSCTAWMVDESKFSLPTHITFKTI